MNDVHQRIRAAVDAFSRGELVIVADDDDRENEGDLFVAASLCTPEKMAFIIRHTSGIVCAPLAQAGFRDSSARVSMMKSALDMFLRRFLTIGRLAVRWPDGRTTIYAGRSGPEAAVVLRGRGTRGGCC